MADEQTLARLAALEAQVNQLTARLHAIEQPNQPARAEAQSPVKPKIPVAPAATPRFAQPIPPPPPQPLFSPPHRAATGRSTVSPNNSRGDFEATIGKNWASWIGAILLLLGICFFLKYAWDQQWIHPTPLMRLASAIFVGLVVGAIGEWTFRRKMKSLAAACFGASVAIIMASFFAGATLFPLGQQPITPTGALEAVFVIAVAGLAISLRVSNPAPAVIALIGAFLAPFILNTGADHSLIFLIYIAIVSALGWAVDWLRWKWLTVRYTACLGAWISYTVWQLNSGSPHQILALIFAGFFFAAFLADLIIPVVKYSGEMAVGIAGSLEDILTILSVLNTAFAFNAFYQILYKHSLHEVGIAALSLALAQVIAAGFLRHGPMKFAARLQAAALVTLAVPLLLNHYSTTAAWALMALSLSVLAWKLDLKWVYRWSVALWVLAVLHLLVIDSFDHGLMATWFSLRDLPVSRWLLMGWGLAALALVIANLRPASVLLPKSKFSPFFHILPALGSLLFLAITLTANQQATWTFAALIWTCAILFFRPLLQLDYTTHLLALFIIITTKWIAVDAIAPTIKYWNLSANVGAFEVLNRVAIAGVLLCIALGGWARQMRHADPIGKTRDKQLQANLPAGIAVWIGGILFVLISVQACRFVDYFCAAPQPVIKQVVLSVLWATIGLASVFIGFHRKIAPLRYAALLLLGVTLIKILLIDMAQVQAIWRILSFLAVGALLLAVSYIYHNQFAEPVSAGK